MKDIIKQKAKQIAPQIIEIRRHIHAHPELSFQEFETQKYVESILVAHQFDQVKRIANTGLEVIIEGKNPSKKVIGLRGDMDALPIIEQNNTAYKSKYEGKMHACGHDVHTSCLLGAGILLNETKHEWEGTVKLVFQPGEEKLPGGASIMIKEGILKNPNIDYMIGQHVMPILPVGKIGFRPGLYMASTDEIYLTIKGKGGHGAQPHQNIDPVTCTAQLIVALQQIVSRHASPIIPSVLSFGKIIAQGATNIIPNEVIIEGTFRTLDEQWRAQAHIKIENMVNHICEAFGCKADLEIRKGYPFLKNNPELTSFLINAAKNYMGDDNVVDLDLWMAAEDFAFYSQEVPSCFYRLGTQNIEKGITSQVHTPTFDIDEEAIEYGVGLMAFLALESLNYNGK